MKKTIIGPSFREHSQTLTKRANSYRPKETELLSIETDHSCSRYHVVEPLQITLTEFIISKLLTKLQSQDCMHFI